MSDAATTQPLTFGTCYVTGQTATQVYRCGAAFFPLSDMGLRILASVSWRRR